MKNIIIKRMHFLIQISMWFFFCTFSYLLIIGVGLGVGIKTHCSNVGPVPEGGEHFVGDVFLKDPSPYMREFRTKPGKTPNS